MLWPPTCGGIRSGTQVGKPVEQHVRADLKAGFCRGKDVFGSQRGQRRGEKDDSDQQEELHSAVDGRREGLDGMACQARSAADLAVPDQDFGEEDGTQEDEEGFYTVKIFLAIR